MEERENCVQDHVALRVVLKVVTVQNMNLRFVFPALREGRGSNSLRFSEGNFPSELHYFKRVKKFP